MAQQTPDERRVSRRKRDTFLITDAISGVIDGLHGYVPPFAVLIGLMAATERYITLFLQAAEEQFGAEGKADALICVRNGLASLEATVARLDHDTGAQAPTMVTPTKTTQTH